MSEREREREKYNVMYCWSEEINLRLPCTHGGKNIYTGQKLSLLHLKVEMSDFYRVPEFRGFELFGAFFGPTREYPLGDARIYRSRRTGDIVLLHPPNEL